MGSTKPRLLFPLLATMLALGCAAGPARRTEGKPAPANSPAGADSQHQENASKDLGRGALFYAQPHVHPEFDPARASFTLHYDDIDSSLTTLPAFVLPRTPLEFSASGGSGSFRATADVGTVVATGTSAWRWTAPRIPGDHELHVRDNKGGSEVVLRVFVLHPYDGSSRFGGRRVGSYVPHAKNDDPAYKRPPGFVEVTEANETTQVSPHFQLGQFVCKDTGDWPRYVALRPELFIKLEALLAALAERGLPASSLHVMSGYRTPAYNAAIGNETSMSRHLYGDAADVFLDRDGDGIEDDLDHDGKITANDSRVLYEIAEQALDDALPDRLAGGLASYGSTPAHGPFLHVDARGHRARW